MTNIESFKSSFDEVPRSNRFRLEGSAKPPNDKLIQNISVPTSSLATLEYRNGEHTAPWKVPYDSILSEITITMMDNTDMKNRRFYEAWNKKIVSQKGFGYYNDYALNKDLKIFQLDRAGKDIFYWHIKEVYPISLGGYGFDQAAANTPASFTVTLAFHSADWIE